jgi:hypothetical protein
MTVTNVYKQQFTDMFVAYGELFIYSFFELYTVDVW